MAVPSLPLSAFERKELVAIGEQLQHSSQSYLWSYHPADVDALDILIEDGYVHARVLSAFEGRVYRRVRLTSLGRDAFQQSMN